MNVTFCNLRKNIPVGLTALVLGMGIGTSAYADPITNTITENNVDWTSAGVSGVGGGTGDITLAGITGPVGTARLYWHGIDSGGDGNYDNANVTINGNAVVGTVIGTATTNCWGAGNSVAYQADVTAYVAGDGVYTIAGMSDGVGHNANGASIVVTFDDGDSLNDRDLAFFEGNDSNIPDGFPGEDDGWHAVLTPINYDGAGTVGIQFHNADGQTFTDGELTLDAGAGPLVIPDAVGLWEGTSVPSAGTSRATNGDLWDIHSFDITSAFAPVPGPVALNLDGMEFTSDCLGLVLALVDLPAGSLPGGDDFSKTLLDGPDENSDGEVDLVIPVKPSTSTAYQWKINWSQADSPDVLIADTAPAESVVDAINGDATGLPIDCGGDAAFDDDSGHIDVYRGGKSGKNCRSATELEWWPDSDSEMLIVDVSMRESPGKGHKEPAFAPTSCGALYLNYGAAAFELDPDTGLPVVDSDSGEVLPPIMESNALCIAAIPDDGNLDYTGAGDHDQDGAEDWAEACEVGTDPCNPDTDGDGVLDGADECPLEGPPDASIGEVQDPNGCNRQSECSDGLDNDDDGPIDYPADASCDSIDDDSEDTVDCPCWNSNDLLNVTADNHRDDFSCGTQTSTEALIQNVSGSTPGLEGGFAADSGPWIGSPMCQTRDLVIGAVIVTADEAANCIQQIFDRCTAIGFPQPLAPLAPASSLSTGGDVFGNN